jgi:hypothetical protein
VPNSSRTDFRSALRLLLPVALLLVLFATAYAQRDTQAPSAAAAPAATTCPGQPAPAPIATGVYTQKPVPDIVINGQPAPGAIWKAGDRSYWHCHTGGQLLMVDSGVGRVQQRGQRARVLRRGETEWAGPGVEHWHGADVNESAHFFQTATVGSQTLWMEEVGRDDYLGNDTGINSRNEFLRTGVKKKN